MCNWFVDCNVRFVSTSYSFRQYEHPRYDQRSAASSPMRWERQSSRLSEFSVSFLRRE